MASRRTLSWLVTAALATSAFVGGRALGDAGGDAATARAPAPPPRVVPVTGGPAAPPASPRPTAEQVDSEGAADAGNELYLQVNEEHPEAGPRTWSAIHNATQRVAERHFRAAGSPVVACMPDGTLDFVTLHVRWSVSSRADRVEVHGGQLTDDDLPPEARRCLDAYFAEVRGVEPSPGPLIELDVLYEFPAAYAGTSARDAAATAP